MLRPPLKQGPRQRRTEQTHTLAAQCMAGRTAETIIARAGTTCPPARLQVFLFFTFRRKMLRPGNLRCATMVRADLA
jgi:hypothetical protein